MIRVIDNFFSERAYNDLLVQIACGPFLDEVNKLDGVTYPMVCRHIPASVTEECSEALPGEHLEFLRASPKGVNCPHPIHHDGSMGRISVMVYTSEIGGTAIMRHNETGIMSACRSDELTALMAQESANIDAWQIMEMCEAKPNRAAIFDASLMHAAIPFGGEGEGVKARTVYTRFIK